MTREPHIGSLHCRGCGSLCALKNDGGALRLYQLRIGTAELTGHPHVCAPLGRTLVHEGRILVGTTAGTIDVTPGRDHRTMAIAETTR